MTILLSRTSKEKTKSPRKSDRFIISKLAADRRLSAAFLFIKKFLEISVTKVMQRSLIVEGGEKNGKGRRALQ